MNPLDTEPDLELGSEGFGIARITSVSDRRLQSGANQQTSLASPDISKPHPDLRPTSLAGHSWILHEHLGPKELRPACWMARGKPENQPFDRITISEDPSFWDINPKVEQVNKTRLLGESTKRFFKLHSSGWGDMSYLIAQRRQESSIFCQGSTTTGKTNTGPQSASTCNTGGSHGAGFHRTSGSESFQGPARLPTRPET